MRPLRVFLGLLSSFALLAFSACGGPSGSPDGDAVGGAVGAGGVGSGAGGASVGGLGSGGAVPNSGGGTMSGGASGTGGASGGATGSGGAATGGGASGGGGNDGGGGGSDGSGGTSTMGAVIVPDASWTCGMPEGIVDPELGELVFEVSLKVGEIYEFGETQYGERRVFDIQSGAVTGSKITANFLEGGLDMELSLKNGAVELEQVNLLRSNDGAVVYMRTCGVAPAGEQKVRIVPDFEAPNSSSLSWLNTGKFVGTRVFDADKKTIELAIYDVSEVSDAGTKVTLKDPADVPNQPWECSMSTGTKGATVLTETVTLGSSISVGASKRGTRNIIPITGGSFSGRFKGTVLPGGADYQLIGGSTVLDARYTLKSEDGEFLLVRNCGPFGALIPWFEARAEGSLAGLNEGAYLSSDPGGASGGVSITFYERN